ncbi:MAG: hypothetical protein VW868_05190, partial [Bacteroidota bacterium]
MPFQLSHNTLFKKLVWIGCASVLCGIGNDYLKWSFAQNSTLFAQTADTTRALSAQNEQIYTVQAGETLFS